MAAVVQSEWYESWLYVLDDWQADPTNPLETKDKFLIQSGRRRLAACRELGIKVKAVVGTKEGDGYQQFDPTSPQVAMKCYKFISGRRMWITDHASAIPGFKILVNVRSIYSHLLHVLFLSLLFP